MRALTHPGNAMVIVITIVIWTGILTGLLTGLLLGGCAMSETVAAGDDPLGDAPPDFTLDLTILSGMPRTHDPRQPAPPPTEAHRRQSRYILFADGSLHYGSDDRRGAEWRPGFVRRLDRAQVSDVWLRLRQIGLADPSAGVPPQNAELIEPDRGELVYVLIVRASDRHWMIRHGTPLNQDPDPALTQIVRHLAELAWAPDAEVERAMVIPERYDFGPDPYARYRR